jgi:hypothetical protein
MATKKLLILFSILMSMFCTRAMAYDIAVKNADSVTIYYNYINDKKDLEVTYETTHYDCYSGSVVIPEEVNYKKRTRKVTRIGYNAFRDCTGLTSVTIPNSVTRIIGLAFAYCDSLKDVYCYAKEAPLTSADAFLDSPVSTATLHVPAASVKKYKATMPWKLFGTIVAIE